jgi:hypothetical protein
LGQRFVELVQQAEAIEAGKHAHRSDWGSGYQVDYNALLNWRVKVRHLISSVCGSDSQHFKLFEESEKTALYDTSHEIFRRLYAVLMAAKEDYEGGYLNKIRNLIQADVFDDELEQAEELLASGYQSPAAVVAGVVLESCLRQLCHDRGLPTGKLNTMNADLAKVGAYNKLTQKQITALADIRNNAAHGNVDQFDSNDVANLIRDVRNLLAGRLT